MIDLKNGSQGVPFPLAPSSDPQALHFSERSFSVMHEFIREVVLDSLIDTAKLLPFLFLTYLAMEFLEHKAKGRALRFIERSGSLGPFLGALIGTVPQCGFSAAAASLYAGRIITVGTLLAVFLSASDEMLPLLIAGNVRPASVLLILGYKFAVGILVGFLADLLLRKRRAEPLHVDALCEKEHCHCEKGILRSALHHTVKISFFLLLITLAIAAAVFFIGEDALVSLLSGRPVLSYLLCALVGLIPNCAASVALTGFYLNGFISAGAMLAGLLPGAGVGILVLFRINRPHKENLLLLSLLLALGFLFGGLFDLCGLSTLL